MAQKTGDGGSGSRRRWLVALGALAALAAAFIIYLALPGEKRRVAPLADMRVPDVRRAIVVPTSASPIIPDELLVLLKGGKSVAEFRRAVQDPRIRVVGSIPEIGLVQVEVPAEQREAVKSELERNPLVQVVLYQSIYKSNAKFNDPALADRNSPDGWGLRAAY